MIINPSQPFDNIIKQVYEEIKSKLLNSYTLSNCNFADNYGSFYCRLDGKDIKVCISKHWGSNDTLAYTIAHGTYVNYVRKMPKRGFNTVTIFNHMKKSLEFTESKIKSSNERRNRTNRIRDELNELTWDNRISAYSCSDGVEVNFTCTVAQFSVLKDRIKHVLDVIE